MANPWVLNSGRGGKLRIEALCLLHPGTPLAIKEKSAHSLPVSTGWIPLGTLLTWCVVGWSAAQLTK